MGFGSIQFLMKCMELCTYIYIYVYIPSSSSSLHIWFTKGPKKKRFPWLFFRGCLGANGLNQIYRELEDQGTKIMDQFYRPYHGSMVYLPTWMLGFYGQCRKKIPYMDPMGCYILSILSLFLQNYGNMFHLNLGKSGSMDQWIHIWSTKWNNFKQWMSPLDDLYITLAVSCFLGSTLITTGS